MVIRKTCRECGERFEICDDEQAFLRNVERQTGNAMYLPNRCLACRQARRQQRYETPANELDDVRLICIECGEQFIFGGRDSVYFASQGFARPKRCRPCRQAKKDGRPALSGAPPQFDDVRRRQ